MDGGVWERVSASFAQHSREDAWSISGHRLWHMQAHTEQEGLCTLHKQPSENTDTWYVFVCICVRFPVHTQLCNLLQCRQMMSPHI